MKYYRHFRVRELGFPAELYEEICAKRPECRKKEDFVVEAQPGDDETSAFIEHLVEFCQQRSLTNSGTGDTGTYGYQVVRHYEPDDLQAADYLMLGTQKRMFRERLGHNASGRLMLPASQSGVTIGFASGMFNKLYVVSDSVRKILEAGNLVGLIFRETMLKGTSARATTEPLWEIDSEIKLPQMTNSYRNPSSSVPCHGIDELPYRNGEPHYRRRDLADLAKFDVARTFERLGSDPALIISKRFYHYCIANKIPVVAQPVRITPN